MNEIPNGATGAAGDASPAARLVHAGRQGGPMRHDDEIDLLDLVAVVWSHKWLIAGFTAIVAIAAAVYALLATEWYRGDVLLAPAERSATPAVGSQLGGLAALAGISAGGDGTVEALAVLQSREFVRQFVVDKKLMPLLLAKSGADVPGQSSEADSVSDTPDTRDAVKYFREELMKVDEDPETGLVTLNVQWTDAQTAADWANELVDRLNSRMRQRALRDSEANVAYLQAELATTNLLTLQQSIGRLLEGEMQKLMLARGSEEFSFRVIDPAQPPRLRSRPLRTLTVVMAAVLGGILSVAFVIFRDAVRRHGQRRGLSV